MAEAGRNDSSTKNTNGRSNNSNNSSAQQHHSSRIRDRCRREIMTPSSSLSLSLPSSPSALSAAAAATASAAQSAPRTRTRTTRSQVQVQGTTTTTTSAVVGFGLIVLIVWVGLSVFFWTCYYVLPSSETNNNNQIYMHMDCSSPPSHESHGLQYNLSSPPPTPFHIFHTVTSRFMVGQPDQPTLARARYELLETFCFPTVAHQTRQNFFWFVLVDPRIDEQVLNDIERLLSSSSDDDDDVNMRRQQNVFMVLTQNPVWAADGVGVPGVDSYGVSLQELAREYEAGRVEIRTGNTTFLLQALDIIEGRSGPQKPKEKATPTPTQKPKRWANNDVESSSSLIVLIETLLDADDGLHTSGIQRIQDEAVQHTARQLELMDSNSNSIVHGGHGVEPIISLNETWWLMCGTDHIEWHNRDIYQMTMKEYEEQGLSSGITGIRHAPVYCASAGYTRVGVTRPAAVRRHQNNNSNSNNEEGNKNETKLLLFPRVAYSNHALTGDFPVCNDGLDLDGMKDTVSENKILARLLFFMPSIAARKEGSNNNKNDVIVSKCFRRVFPHLPFVLKSRTITSDSMDHMSVKQKDYRDLPWQNKSEYPLLINETEKTWRILQSDFSISRLKAWKTSIYLREHMEAILEENRAARCAPGFPCREVADVQFKRVGMLVKGLKRKDAYEVKKQQKLIN